LKPAQRGERISLQPCSFAKQEWYKLPINSSHILHSASYLKIDRDINLDGGTTTSITEVEFQEDFKCFCWCSPPDVYKPEEL